jgi:D-alanine-D-alanine ligase
VRIAITFDEAATLPTAAADARGVLETVEAVDGSLRWLGHTTRRIAIPARGTSWLACIEQLGADVVFNLCEGSGADEAAVAGALALAGLRFTGGRAETLSLARRKDRTNALLAAAGIPVPDWTVLNATDPLPDWTLYPAIVKPAAEDASVGITQSSVARSSTELAAAVAANRERSPLLVQSLVTGREFNVGLLGEEVLPVAEIEFDLPAGWWPIVSYDAKWAMGSAEDRGTRPRCPAEIDAPLERHIVDTARRAWHTLGGCGYGRVDLRLDAAGRPQVLEVNPNPDLAPGAGLARMGRAAGLEYPSLVERVLEQTLA